MLDKEVIMTWHKLNGNPRGMISFSTDLEHVYFGIAEDSALFVDNYLLEMNDKKRKKIEAERKVSHKSTLTDAYITKWNAEKDEYVKKFGTWKPKYGCEG